MKVAFDCTTAAFEKKTGTGVYVAELVRSYEELFPEDTVYHTYRFTRYLKGHRFILEKANPKNKTHILQDPITAWRGQQYDIFHGLNSRLPYLWGGLSIATIHDLFSLYGRFASEAFREVQMENLLTMIQRAQHLISVSHYTKRVLVERLGIPSEKVSVVHNGVKTLFTVAKDPGQCRIDVENKFQITKPFFFFVGALEKRKNVVGIVRAYSLFFEKLKSQGHDIPDLILAGHPSFGYEEIRQAIMESPARGSIHQIGFVNDEILNSLYRASLGLIYLSLEEGYGIPVLEAMACGTPVLSSDTTSLPEVGGGHTWMVGPEDVSSAADVLLKFWRRDQDVNTKVQNAMAVAQGRTWHTVARETRAVYEKVLRS